MRYFSLYPKKAAIDLRSCISLHQILSRYGRDEQATLVAISGVVLVLFLIVNEMASLFDTIRDVFGI